MIENYLRALVIAAALGMIALAHVLMILTGDNFY